MAVSPVLACGVVYSGLSDETSKMVDSVVSKLNIRQADKKKYIDEINLAVNECVVPDLNHFSENAACAIRAGEAPQIPLFMIMASYVFGKKIKTSLPRFIKNFFDKREIDGIEHHRKLLRESETLPFSFEDGFKRSLESFYDWSGLDPRSSKDQIFYALIYACS